MGLSGRCGKRYRWAELAWMILILCPWFPSSLSAAPLLLRCEIREGSQTFTADFVPGSDPYATEPKEFNRRFLFKAVLIGNEQSIDSIKIYTYYKEEHQVVLLHEVEYLPPFRQSEPSFAALTGVNYLYAPALERELQYGCKLLDGPS